MGRVRLWVLVGLLTGLLLACKQQGAERKKSKSPGQGGDAVFTGSTQTGNDTPTPSNNDAGDLGSNSSNDDDDDRDDDREDDDLDTDADLAGSEELDIDTTEVSMSKRADLTITDYSGDTYEEGGTFHLALLDREGDILEEKTASWPAKGKTVVVKDMCNNLGDTELELKISGGDHDSPILVGNKWIKRDTASTDREPRIIVEFQTGFLCIGDCVDDNKAGFKCPGKSDVIIEGL